MKKQFEILDKIYKSLKESEERISVLREQIEAETNKIRHELINAYSHDSDIIYLVQFDMYRIHFYKATKVHLYEVRLSWYDSKLNIKIPKTFEEAELLLKNIKEPTNCEILSYRDFGYFDDIKKKWERLDWIIEETVDNKFLFEVEESEFVRAVDLVCSFYGIKI